MDAYTTNGLLWQLALAQWLFESGLYFDLQLIKSESGLARKQSQLKQLRDWCQRLFVSDTYYLLCNTRVSLPSPTTRVLNPNRGQHLPIDLALFEKIVQVFDLGG